jgi:hypothetical protein
MVDWTILSPTFLTAAVEWAGAIVTVLDGADRRTTSRRESNDDERARYQRRILRDECDLA